MTKIRPIKKQEAETQRMANFLSAPIDNNKVAKNLMRLEPIS